LVASSDEKIHFLCVPLNLDGHYQPTEVRERKERDGTKSPVTGTNILTA